MLSKACQDKLQKMVVRHSLPSRFLSQAEQYYAPLSEKLADLARVRKPLFVGIQGVQGSGKSTAAAFVGEVLKVEYGLNVAVVSIDDFYFTKAQRQAMAKKSSPLFKTRGVPGTHDIKLLDAMFDSIALGEGFDAPTFDKAMDDRSKLVNRIAEQVDILILEGWCVGVGPQELIDLDPPINDLERNEDSQRHWRRTVNQKLAGEYAQLFERLDRLVVLQAPSFDSVYAWRLLQEEKLIAGLRRDSKAIGNTQSPEQIKQFISYFERLSRHALITMPSKADFLLKLNAGHNIEDLVGID